MDVVIRLKEEVRRSHNFATGEPKVQNVLSVSGKVYLK